MQSVRTFTGSGFLSFKKLKVKVKKLFELFVILKNFYIFVVPKLLIVLQIQHIFIENTTKIKA